MSNKATFVLKLLFSGKICFICSWFTSWKKLYKRWKNRSAYFKEMKRHGKKERCDRLPPDVFKQPDPMIYSQHYLKSLGYAVTWNNPDIQLKKNGIPVSSDHLFPDTEYEVEARIWNGSNEAPALGLPVDFSFVNFGMANMTSPIGQTKVDLPVRGAPGHPAFTTIKWRTPAEPGHYCIRVNLIWSNDANPANNQGQENCDVANFNSPTARFQLTLKNDFPARQSFNLVADSYQIPSLPPCTDTLPSPAKGKLSFDQKKQRRDHFLRIHNQAGFPVPDGWTVDIEPQHFSLGVGEEQLVNVAITHSFPGFTGEKTFNVNAYAKDKLIGGVTLTAKT